MKPLKLAEKAEDVSVESAIDSHKNANGLDVPGDVAWSVNDHTSPTGSKLVPVAIVLDPVERFTYIAER